MADGDGETGEAVSTALEAVPDPLALFPRVAQIVERKPLWNPEPIRAEIQPPADLVDQVQDVEVLDYGNYTDYTDDGEVFEVERADVPSKGNAIAAVAQLTAMATAVAMDRRSRRVSHTDYELWARRAGGIPAPPNVKTQWAPRLAGMPVTSPPNNPPCEWCEISGYPESVRYTGEAFITNKYYRSAGSISLVCLGHALMAKESALNKQAEDGFAVTPFQMPRKALTQR